MEARNEFTFTPVDKNTPSGRIKTLFIKCANCDKRMNIPSTPIPPDKIFNIAVQNIRTHSEDLLRFICPHCGKETVIGLYITHTIRDN